MGQLFHQGITAVQVYVDDKDSFYRMFILLPNFVSLFNNLCLPLMHVDGAYANNTLYDGTIIMLVAKLGNGSGIPLAIAHVPIESSVHLVWLLLLLVRVGLDVEGFPWFSRQGKSPFCCQSFVFTVLWVAIINKVLS
jgi:hypothetical protein